MTVEDHRDDGGPGHVQLGLFCVNLERGGIHSSVPGTLELNWDTIVRIAQRADRMGLEMLVPVARWRGFGGEIDYARASYDTFCWAAGLAASTENIRLMTTCHAPTIHPIVAAKQLVTADHISHGRIGLNVVAGWFRPELEMFGAPMLEHDRRYDLAEEWIRIVDRLWTSDEEFDFIGDFFQVRNAMSEPKPVQRPRPPVMNAGGSERGLRFAAEFADLVFLGLPELQAGDLAGARAKVDGYRRTARRRYGRELQAWTHVSVVCADTTAEAEHRLRDILTGGDVRGVTTLLEIMGVPRGRFGDAEWSALVDRFVVGWGAPIVVGDPGQVAAELGRMASAGLRGILLSLPEWDADLRRLGDAVLPALRDLGYRHG